MILTGRVQDKIDHPMLSSALNPLTLEPVPGKPPVGMPYLDPSFGTIITRIAEADQSQGADNAILKPMYSTMQAWNAGEGTEGESILLLWDRSRGHVLYNGEYPYNFISVLPIAPTDIEHVIWDEFDPFVLYYPTQKNQGRCQLMKVTLRPTYSEEIYFDFSNAPYNLPPTALRNEYGLGKDPEVNLGPRQILGLCGGTDGEYKVLFSITERRVISHFKYAFPEWKDIAPVMTPTEQHIYMAGGYVYGPDWKYQRKLAAKFYYEHSMIGAGAGGDTWNTVAYDPSSPGANDVGSLVCHDLDTGVARVILGPSTGWNYPASGTHISALGPAGWVLVSSVGSAHNGQQFGDNELTLANTDTGAFYRIGHTRTWAGTNCGPNGDQCPSGYNGESHGVISRKGDRLLFGSDGLGFTGLPFKGVDPYIVDLRKPTIQVRTKHVAGITSLSPFQAHDAHLEGYEVVND